jgi:DNA mismatch repair ATPase MutS
MIQWKTIGKKKIPEPVAGLDETFDNANAKIESIKREIDEYVTELKKRFKTQSITLTTASKGFRYQIEVPHDVAEKIPDSFTNTSNTKDMSRF